MALDDLIQSWRATHGYHGYAANRLLEFERADLERIPDPTARIRARQAAVGWALRRAAQAQEREDAKLRP